MSGDEAGRRRTKLVELCAALPETTCTGEQHLGFRVGRRVFAYYMNDHHGDGLITLACKVPPGDMEALVEMDPERFFRPSYLGVHGWVGLRLDLPHVDWEEVAKLVTISYQLVAARRLAAQVATDGLR
jgi:predicted DNA-binding protein (MmcQ/YjbR family)